MQDKDALPRWATADVTMVHVMTTPYHQPIAGLVNMRLLSLAAAISCGVDDGQLFVRWFRHITVSI